MQFQNNFAKFDKITQLEADIFKVIATSANRDAMTTIQHKQEITLINIFTVEPEKQQSAADKVAKIYQTFVSNQPGFISAKVHKSLDGTRVAAVAQWESQSALTAMQQNSDFQNLVKILDGDIVTAEPHIYTIINSIGS